MTATITPEESLGPAPIDAEGRIHALDIIRGFALFGMILVHFHQKMRLEVAFPEDLIGWAVYILVEEKAWGTFALLFGVGFAVLLRRLESRQQPVVPIYLRRLATLAFFGVIAEVGFGFSILYTYACWGLGLLVVRRWSTRALLIAATVSAAARPVVSQIVALWHWWHGTPFPVPAILPLMRAEQAAAVSGTYLELVAARWMVFVGSIADVRTWILPDMDFTLFIIGLLAVRHGVVDEPGRHTRLIRAWMVFGFVSWLLSWVVLRNIPGIPIRGAGWQINAGYGILSEQWLCFTYAGAVLLLLTKKPEWTARLAAIGNAGRMALTNYMAQVVALDWLASGYGVGLKLRPLVYAPSAVVCFAVVAALSTAWLARFRFGPLEWVWRTATYLRPQPLRRGRAAA